MSIFSVKPTDCPIDLRVRIERVMQQERKTWEQVIRSLALKVVSPTVED